MSDSLKVGEMRHYLRAMTKSETKTSGGMVVHAWVYAFSFYASTDAVKSQESFANLMPSVRTTVIFTTWIRDDIKRDMQIEEGEDKYRIIGLSPHFKTMDVECERIEP